MEYVLTVDSDSDPECPLDSPRAWSFVSFHRHNRFFKDPPGLIRVGNGDVKAVDPGLRSKLRRGLAFVLECYSHSETRYSLKGEGPQCRWDTAPVAGLLIWEHASNEMGAKSCEERAESARLALAEYNAWANGRVFGYSLAPADREASPDAADSCWGFTDAAHMGDAVGRLLKAGDRVRVAGPGKDWFDARGLPGGVEVADGFGDRADEAVVVHPAGGGHRPW